MSDISLFETVLASTVHDMKNSLGLILGQLDSVTQKLVEDAPSQQLISTLRYETSRVNLSLMQLLTLYKVDHDQLNLRKVEVDVQDFLEDCLASHESLAKIKSIDLKMICDDELRAFFDPDIIEIAINNVIGNSIRYTQSKVYVSAKFIDQGLLIEIADDGRGYPEEMLLNPDVFINRVNYRTGSTGLGLYFAAIVSNKHQRGSRSGYIKLDNKSTLGGGRFQLFIP